MPNTEPKIEEWMRESILEIDSMANPLLSENIAIIAKHYAAHRDERVKELEEALYGMLLRLAAETSRGIGAANTTLICVWPLS